MLIKSTAIQRLLRENPMLKERRFGLPYVGARLDKEEFNPTVQEIADAIDFYGYEVRDENIVNKKGKTEKVGPKQEEIVKQEEKQVKKLGKENYKKFKEKIKGTTTITFLQTEHSYPFVKPVSVQVGATAGIFTSAFSSFLSFFSVFSPFSPFCAFSIIYL